jgi:hypothetical protein
VMYEGEEMSLQKIIFGPRHAVLNDELGGT